MRLINIGAENKKENNDKARKHVEYVLRDEAVQKRLIYFNMVECDDPLTSFGFFARSQCKDDGRVGKHLIVSYGSNGCLEWGKCLEMTKEIADFFGQNYQVIAAVHDNIPDRPHAHILIDAFDVMSEKKMSEGPNEFWQLVEHINQVLSKHGAYPLLQGRVADADDTNICDETGDYCSIADNVEVETEVTGNWSIMNLVATPLPVQTPQPFAGVTLEGVKRIHRFLYPDLYYKDFSKRRI